MEKWGLFTDTNLVELYTGLMRVRAFTQDDAHVFCTKEQIEEQIIEIIDLYDKFYTVFGFEYHIELSTKPDKAIGSDEIWKWLKQT